MCDKAEDLRNLAGKERFYEAFKDDHVVHLYTLRQGGEAPVEYLEKLAEAFGLDVDLRDPETREDDARRLHITYGLKSTMYIIDQLRSWARDNDRKVMVLLSYDTPQVEEYLESGERFDEDLLNYLDSEEVPYVDALEKSRQDYQDFSVPAQEYLKRFYIARAGAQVFGHYNPYGNFWFAFAVKNGLVDWLDPNPPSYR
jgi:hypothetical protein